MLLALLYIILFESSGYRQVPVMDFSMFEPNLHHTNDTTYVFNFWATWCAPCREEIPDLEKLNQHYKDHKIKIVLVSLDMPGRLEGTLIPFIQQNKITTELWLLDDPDFNSWINKVDTAWGGNIPATLIYKGNERHFINRKTDFEELNHIVQSLM